MSESDRSFLLSEIKRIAEETGETPGRRKFSVLSGLPDSFWYGRLYPSWSDALAAANLSPNKKNARVDRKEIVRQYAEIIRSIGKVPTHAQLRIIVSENAGYFSHNTFQTGFGRKGDLLEAVVQAETVPEGVKFLVRQELSKLKKTETAEPPSSKADPETGLAPGLVYLLKSGQHYKIGRSGNIERRIKSIAVSLPEEAELIHTIKTDDTVGIEKYWHERFKAERLNGEWFKLAPQQVRAFMKRREQ